MVLNLSLDDQLALISRLEDASAGEDPAMVLQIAQHVLGREDTFQRSATRLMKLVGSLEASQRYSLDSHLVMTTETSSADNPEVDLGQDWSVEVIENLPTSRIFIIARGDEAHMLRFRHAVVTTLVYFDNRRIRATRKDGAAYYELTGISGEVEVESRPINHIAVEIWVDGMVLYSEFAKTDQDR